MSRIQKVVVYHEGVAICEDDSGRFLFEEANVILTPLPEMKKCYLTGLRPEESVKKYEIELEMA